MFNGVWKLMAICFGEISDKWDFQIFVIILMPNGPRI